MLNFQLIKLSFDDDDGISGSWEVWTIVIIFVIICQLVTIEDKRKTGIKKKNVQPIDSSFKVLMFNWQACSNEFSLNWKNIFYSWLERKNSALHFWKYDYSSFVICYFGKEEKVYNHEQCNAFRSVSEFPRIIMFIISPATVIDINCTFYLVCENSSYCLWF